MARRVNIILLDLVIAKLLPVPLFFPFLLGGNSIKIFFFSHEGFLEFFFPSRLPFHFQIEDGGGEEFLSPVGECSFFLPSFGTSLFSF